MSEDLDNEVQTVSYDHSSVLYVVLRTYHTVCDFVACMIILLSYYNCSTSRYSTRSFSLPIKLRCDANPWSYRYLGFQIYPILDGLTPCEYKSIKDSDPFSPQKGSVNHLASKHVDVELKFYQA